MKADQVVKLILLAQDAPAVLILLGRDHLHHRLQVRDSAQVSDTDLTWRHHLRKKRY